MFWFITKLPWLNSFSTATFQILLKSLDSLPLDQSIISPKSSNLLLMIVYQDSFLILCLPEVQFFQYLKIIWWVEKLVFVISGNYNVLYVNECKLKSLYIFTITAKLLYLNSILQKSLLLLRKRLNSWNYLGIFIDLTLSHSVTMNKKLLLNC